MKAKVGILLAIVVLVGVIASGCIGSQESSETETTGVELTGDFTKDILAIGRTLESNGINEVKLP